MPIEQPKAVSRDHNMKALLFFQDKLDKELENSKMAK